jgi:hypothetical protein
MIHSYRWFAWGWLRDHYWDLSYDCGVIIIDAGRAYLRLGCIKEPKGPTRPGRRELGDHRL